MLPKFTNIGLDKLVGIQKIHKKNSYRVGGVCLFSIILIWGYFRLNLDIKFLFYVGLILIFIIGFIEDIYQNTPIFFRLIFIFISAAILVFSTDAIIFDADIKWINTIFQIPMVPYIFTIIGIVVVSNAWNFIDGLNGLSSGLAIIILSLFGYLAKSEGLYDLSLLSWTIAFSVMGFFIINILFGKVFLGDSGALTLGLFIGWSGVELVTKGQSVSSWVVLFIIIYPATEIIFSFFRRLIGIKKTTGADNLHFHSLFYFYLSKKLNQNPNSISGICLLIFGSVPSLYIYLYGLNFYRAIYGSVIFIFLYTLLYLMLLHYKKNYLFSIKV